MKRIIILFAVCFLLLAGTAVAGDSPFSVHWKSGTTEPFDTSSGVTTAPSISEGTACVWVLATADDIYFTLDGTKPVATAGAGGNGTVLAENEGVPLLPDEAKRFRFTGGGSSAGWVTYHQYDGWIEPW